MTAVSKGTAKVKRYIANLPARTKLVYDQGGKPELFEQWLDVWKAAGFSTNIVYIPEPAPHEDQE